MCLLLLLFHTSDFNLIEKANPQIWIGGKDGLDIKNNNLNSMCGTYLSLKFSNIGIFFQRDVVTTMEGTVYEGKRFAGKRVTKCILMFVANFQ